MTHAEHTEHTERIAHTTRETDTTHIAYTAQETSIMTTADTYLPDSVQSSTAMPTTSIEQLRATTQRDADGEVTTTLWYDNTSDINQQAHQAERIVRHEWDQFQRVNNEGGRANCQGNWPTFHQMRVSQFLTWPLQLQQSYMRDLDDADREGRNLLTEKYARMMQSTEPERYKRELEPVLPVLSADRIARQERVIATQVQWAREFRQAWPKLGVAMRVLTTAEDEIDNTSFETYLRGELCTYSDTTFNLYESMIAELVQRHCNLTEATLLATVRLGGFANLAEAEAAQ